MALKSVDAQPPLIAMSQEELSEAGQKLARLVRERAEMLAQFREVRAEQRADLEKLEAQIASVADTIRSQGR